MAPFTNRSHLAEYFAYGLNILNGLGLQPTGATSPGASCREIEWDYQAAIRDAVRAVCGRQITWYFLHVDTLSPVVLPRVMTLDAERGEACVSMVSATGDPSWRTQFNEPSTLDELITEDGQSGRLVELYRNRSAIGFHTHWQSLFSEGRATGLKDFRVTLRRIREHLGDGVLWMKCSELAQLVAAQAVTRATAEEREDRVEIRLASTISCPDFTVNLQTEREVRSVQVSGRDLRRLPDGSERLEPGSWRKGHDGVAWCADLAHGETTLSLC